MCVRVYVCVCVCVYRCDSVLVSQCVSVSATVPLSTCRACVWSKLRALLSSGVQFTLSCSEKLPCDNTTTEAHNPTQLASTNAVINTELAVTVPSIFGDSKGS